jgi:hypothetical protein
MAMMQILPTVVDVSERMAAHLAAATGPAAPPPPSPAVAAVAAAGGCVSPVNMSRMADRITLDIIGKLLYDRDFRAVENE